MSWYPDLHIGELRPWPDAVYVWRGNTGESQRYLPDDFCALARENNELRELVRELYEDQCIDGDQWKYRNRMRELGVEV